jgi:hypothetical protein
MLCDCFILIDPKHPDGNTLDEIVSALKLMSATIIEINTERHVIEAVVPCEEIATLEHLGGVCYVRPVFTYCPSESPAAA